MLHMNFMSSYNNNNAHVQKHADNFLLIHKALPRHLSLKRVPHIHILILGVLPLDLSE